jgi:hypothetical protein
MSTRSTRSTAPAQTALPGEHEEGSGWVSFAGVMIAIVGIMNVIYGIAAIDSANFYVNNARYVFSDLNTWGWVMLCLGVLQVAASVSILGGTSWGRWVGIGTAGLNAIAQLLFLPSYPLLSLALFTLDILVLYGLIAHGRKAAI